jgi:hypothetical protein
MVMKKSERSWKQLSRTLSTVASLYVSTWYPGYLAWDGRPERTPVFAVLLVLSRVIEQLHLLDGLVVELLNILAADIFGAVLLEEE